MNALEMTKEMNAEIQEDRLNRLMAQQFAEFMRAYQECGDEVQHAVLEMVKIVNADDATEEERLSAIDTIAEALFPRYHNGKLGIDLESCDEPDEKYASSEREELNRQEKSFSEKLHALMEQKRITQSQLAQTTGVGQSAIAMMLKRECRPQRRTIEKLAKALAVEPSELWKD